MCKLDLEKAEEPEIKLPTSAGSSKKQENSRSEERRVGKECYSYLFQNFPQFIVIHTVKGFGIVNKAEIDVFLELSCFFNDAFSMTVI